jgi:hypothetical protein
VGQRWNCYICGALHEGLPLSWGFDEPHYWTGSDLQRSTGSCTEDVCWFDEDDGNHVQFVRGTIEVPILDGESSEEESFLIGAWTSLSETNFRWLLDHWTAGAAEQGTPWFGWLSSHIPAYTDTLSLKTNVHLRGGELRPLIEVQRTDHPLARDQHEGITIARARELAERWLHL